MLLHLIPKYFPQGSQLHFLSPFSSLVKLRYYIPSDNAARRKRVVVTIQHQFSICNRANPSPRPAKNLFYSPRIIFQLLYCPQSYVQNCGCISEASKLQKNICCCCYLIPFEGWGIVEDHAHPEAGKLSRACPRGCKETESSQKASGANSP